MDSSLYSVLEIVSEKSGIRGKNELEGSEFDDAVRKLKRIVKSKANE